MSDDRRIKVLNMDWDCIKDVLNWFEETTQNTMLAIPQIEGLPIEYEIVDVRLDSQRRCFSVFIRSDEFEELALGALPEIMNGYANRLAFRAIALKNDQAIRLQKWIASRARDSRVNQADHERLTESKEMVEYEKGKAFAFEFVQDALTDILNESES